MDALNIFVYYEIYVIMIALLVIIFYQLLTGKINTKKMLFDKQTGKLSPGRVQLLFMTFAGASYYFLKAVESSELPDIPQELLLLVGSSQLLYLGGKAEALLQLFRSKN